MTTPQGHQPATPIKRCASCGAPVTQQPAQHYADARAYLLAKLSTRPAAKSPAGKMLVSRQHLASIYTDLLEALSKFVEFAELHGEVVFAGGGMTVIDAMNACTTKARAAIAKATGGQS